MIPHVITYVTQPSPYEEKVKKLQESCDLLGLKLFIHTRNHPGDRQKALFLKAEVLLSEARRHQPFIYVDADAQFVKQPVLLDDSLYGPNIMLAATKNGRGDYRTGTLLVRPHPDTIEVLEEWVERLRGVVGPNKGDQPFLSQILRTDPSRVALLPQSYAHVSRSGKAGPNTVVLHHASLGWLPRDEEHRSFWSPKAQREIYGD